jgi:hypothetical protein
VVLALTTSFSFSVSPLPLPEVSAFEYKDPAAMLSAIKAIVHDGKTVQEAATGLAK